MSKSRRRSSRRRSRRSLPAFRKFPPWLIAAAAVIGIGYLYAKSRKA
jgi:hypothetical protein